ncbi:hypothetical protein LOC67_16575 [Stieleria sp. JC731]|uniref:hypothetical protein n=1 Tax=Pirellulaceae TaxID=2691357 RepID=UPI001E47E7E7|nr:hypothetical protein [Stieleria sp. JC731]MCC9602174.1 hypothetical protein [Stieleria sp. JC731]
MTTSPVSAALAPTNQFPTGVEMWTGCDWETEFGPLKLNLQGVRSRQAMLAASATRGQEAEQWKNAAIWLKDLEEDARRATELWHQATQAELDGRLDQALKLRCAAEAIERKYPRNEVPRGVNQPRLRTGLGIPDPSR